MQPARRDTCFKGLMAANRDHKSLWRHAGSVGTSNAVLCRATTDLQMLTTRTPREPTPTRAFPGPPPPLGATAF